MALKAQATRLKNALFDTVDPDRAWYGINRRSLPRKSFDAFHSFDCAIESLTAAIVIFTILPVYLLNEKEISSRGILLQGDSLNLKI